jgi:16S rRNA (guanine966-N2)-methyltransferase
MRVIGGSARNISLKTLPGESTRPILDRLKKSLFSMLEAQALLLDANAADLYAGAGTQGIEALSRGAARCVFSEQNSAAVRLLHENLAKTSLAARAAVHCAPVTSVLNDLAASGSQPFDLIFYDPPFVFSRAPESRAACETELALAGRLLYPGHARLILRCEKIVQPPAPKGLELARHWTDGPHAFVFYRRG